MASSTNLVEKRYSKIGWSQFWRSIHFLWTRYFFNYHAIMPWKYFWKSHRTHGGEICQFFHTMQWIHSIEWSDSGDSTRQKAGKFHLCALHKSRHATSERKRVPFLVPWTEDDAFFQDLLHDPNDCRGKRIISTETVKLLPNVKTADLSVWIDKTETDNFLTSPLLFFACLGHLLKSS